MTDVVRLRIHRSKAFVQGAAFGTLGVLFCAMSLIAMTEGVLNWPSVMILAMAVPPSIAAINLIGIGLRRPIGLRMDAKGISGLFISPAVWSEIADIGIVKADKGKPVLGFALHDPIGFRDRQSAWQRLKSFSSGRGTGYHLTILTTILEDADPGRLLEQAQAHHAAAKSGHTAGL